MSSKAKIIYLTAGAGGMYCGSCLHDNALARSMMNQGWDVQLVPTYTPIRTDEKDVSIDQVLFGGINVFIQQKIPLFRHLPMFVDRFLSAPWLIRRATAKAVDTDAATLGGLALSMLKGMDGFQRKEVQRLCQWLKREKPGLLILTNLLIGGCLPTIKRELNIPILVTLQGDDVFLDGLKAPFRQQCIDQMKQLITLVDGFIVHSEFFRQKMSDYFEIPIEKIHVTPLGIDVQDYRQFLSASPSKKSERRTIGYLARLAPEKGLQNLAEAFVRLKQQPQFADVRLLIAGWLGPPNLDYAKRIWQKLDSAGLNGDYQYLGSIDRDEKLEMLSELDLLCVPTEFQEPKGLYALEAMAAGVPLVVPDHGAFPEVIEQSKGGLLYSAGSIDSLVEQLCKLLLDEPMRQKLGRQGLRFVHEERNGEKMAASTGALIEQFLS